MDRFDQGRPTPHRRLIIRTVALSSRLWMTRANTLQMVGAEQLERARAQGRGLITFSNHHSLFDDPLLTACLAEARWETTRWIAADALNFFGSPLRAFLFNGGKCVPVVRGAGVEQPGMDFLADRVRAGEWMHVFPEGGRSREPAGALQRPLKTGLATLVRAARPILLPFHHVGMRDVLPIGATLPRIGHTVRLRFGAITDADAELADQPIEAITAWAEAQLLALEADNPA